MSKCQHGVNVVTALVHVLIKKSQQVIFCSPQLQTCHLSMGNVV